MYAVGVGSAVEDELKEIASEPTGEHYFYTADFKAMSQIAKKLQINICHGQKLPLNINKYFYISFLFNYRTIKNDYLEPVLCNPTEEDPCECDSLVKFQKKVEDALQALTKKYILYNR